MWWNNVTKRWNSGIIDALVIGEKNIEGTGHETSNNRRMSETFRRISNSPTRVKGHCRAVADTACRIGRALNRHGHHFDLELVNAAGLLHDIARVKEHHWDVGADCREELGYVQKRPSSGSI